MTKKFQIILDGITEESEWLLDELVSGFNSTDPEYVGDVVTDLRYHGVTMLEVTQIDDESRHRP